MNTTPSHEIDSLDPDLLEKPLATGRTAEVFDSGNGWVVKLFAFGTDKEQAMAELDALKTAKLAGIAVPEPGDLVLMKMRWGYAMKKVDGPNGMDLIEHGQDAEEAGRIYADLHFGITQKPGKFLPDLVERVKSKISGSSVLNSDEKVSLLERLETLPKGTSFLHGDLHPGNVLWPSESAPVFVDWLDAAKGHPAADLARSLVLFGYQTMAGDDGSRAAFTASFLGKWEEASPGISELAMKWLPIMRAVRVSEPAEPSPDELVNLIRADLA